jgi:hypothetical protein
MYSTYRINRDKFTNKTEIISVVDPAVTQEALIVFANLALNSRGHFVAEYTSLVTLVYEFRQLNKTIGTALRLTVSHDIQAKTF